MWTGWTRCPVMCGGANVTRTRLCNAPVPSNGGRFCNGSSTDSMICGNSTCPGNKSIIIFFFFFTKEKRIFFPFFLTTCSKDPREISIAYDAIILFSRNPTWIRNDELF